jgi:superfamily II DNA/RNA helicase
LSQNGCGTVVVVVVVGGVHQQHSQQSMVDGRWSIVVCTTTKLVKPMTDGRWSMVDGVH